MRKVFTRGPPSRKGLGIPEHLADKDVGSGVAKFGELARFAPTIVPTYDACKVKFMHGLRPEVAKHIDSGREGHEYYTDIVQRALRNDG